MATKKIIKKFVMNLGKMNWNEKGNYTHPVKLEVELRERPDLKNGELSICGDVWMPNKKDITMGGQCLDSIDENLLEPEFREIFKEVRGIWRLWHLNAMQAGSVPQREALHEKFGLGGAPYETACEYLASVNLHPDANGYEYGSKWLKQELPQEVVDAVSEWEKNYAN